MRYRSGISPSRACQGTQSRKQVQPHRLAVMGVLKREAKLLKDQYCLIDAYIFFEDNPHSRLTLCGLNRRDSSFQFVGDLIEAVR
jgi:hypothetical protein